MEDIADADYMHAQRIFKNFDIKNLGEYHDLYVQGHTVLLADLCENFRNICINMHEFDPVKFLSVPVFSWQASLKKTKRKLGLLTDGRKRYKRKNMSLDL